MQILLSTLAVAVVIAATPALKVPESLLVRAVVSGDTIDVEQIGRVRLLGIEVPTVVGAAARERLSGLVLRHWVRLETEGRAAYVVTGDGVCANIVLVREGLARVSARAPHARLDELNQAQEEAQRLEKGLWGYTRRPQPNKRRSSWPISPSSTHRSARFANATSSITDSITGRSGSSSFSSRQGR